MFQSKLFAEMKFGPTLTVLGSVKALSNTEVSQFKCRSGSFYSYSHGNGNECKYCLLYIVSRRI